MGQKKESIVERIITGLFHIFWSVTPALGGMIIMNIADAPLWAGIGTGLLLFPIFGIFDRVNEINNKIKETNVYVFVENKK